jgi:hypothetical protein
VRCASRYTLTTAMSSHKTCLICCCRRGCTLLHLGLGQILAVDRDIGPTLGALKDRLAPLILQRCCGPCMWRALLRHMLLPPQTRRLFLPLRLLASCVASNFLAPLSPTLRHAGCPRSWRTGGQDVPHLVRGRGRRRAPFAPRCAPATGSPVGLRPKPAPQCVSAAPRPSSEYGLRAPPPYTSR